MSYTIQTPPQPVFMIHQFPEVQIVIKEYCVKTRDYSLYEFIKGLIKTFNSNNSTIYDDAFAFLKSIDSISFDEFYLERLMFNIQVAFYTSPINMTSLDWINEMNNIYKPCTQFKHWCDNWQVIYTKHSKMNIFIKKYLKPVQIQFLERLLSPYTKIGRNYIIKKMNSIPWNEI